LFELLEQQPEPSEVSDSEPINNQNDDSHLDETSLLQEQRIESQSDLDNQQQEKDQEQEEILSTSTPSLSVASIEEQEIHPLFSSDGNEDTASDGEESSTLETISNEYDADFDDITADIMLTDPQQISHESIEEDSYSNESTEESSAESQHDNNEGETSSMVDESEHHSEEITGGIETSYSKTGNDFDREVSQVDVLEEVLDDNDNQDDQHEEDSPIEVENND
jgi:hypothetical protein